MRLGRGCSTALTIRGGCDRGKVGVAFLVAVLAGVAAPGAGQESETPLSGQNPSRLVTPPLSVFTFRWTHLAATSPFPEPEGLLIHLESLHRIDANGFPGWK